MSLAQRTISSLSWKGGTSFFRVAILLGRSIALARLLPVDVFGIYAGAIAIATITGILFNFGLGGAFIFISNQGVGESRAATAHFTLNILFKTVWALLLITFAMLYLEGPARLALIVVALANGLTMLTSTPQLILSRRVVHRRLALLESAIDIGATIAALVLAFLGAGLWALLATNVVAGVMSIFFLYLYRPVWIPRINFSSNLIRPFLRFGSRNVWVDFLQVALDRFDDLWTVIYLGTYQMGLYSRAYTFAAYPRRILAKPANSIAMGVYAELSDERQKLSEAFFRINALLVRAGFLIAGVLALIAPEFIHLILGDKWLPFLQAFRLMLVFTMLDPIKLTVSHLFVALGMPEKVVRVRLVQLALLGIGLFSLGTFWGISGVALAVDLMLVIGIFLLLWQAHEFVDFSTRKLFQAPTIALLISGILTYFALHLPHALDSDWHSALIKIAVFVPAYLGLWFLQERKDMQKFMGMVGDRKRKRDL